MKKAKRFKCSTILIKDNYTFILVILSIIVALLLIVFLTFGSYYNDARKKPLLSEV